MWLIYALLTTPAFANDLPRCVIEPCKAREGSGFISFRIIQEETFQVLGWGPSVGWSEEKRLAKTLEKCRERIGLQCSSCEGDFLKAWGTPRRIKGCDEKRDPIRVKKTRRKQTTNANLRLKNLVNSMFTDILLDAARELKTGALTGARLEKCTADNALEKPATQNAVGACLVSNQKVSFVVTVSDLGNYPELDYVLVSEAQ